ncbi:hypothetical protein [Halalkalibacter alkalisediminis]|uniref:Uncharacterized protein n=1 Tax=Halalkalibacter alkalisediminis TaxID=935616 RepID=A0ABV6NDT4_9BACI|nr:hypothetical protein [Halalkalibacter alkalisediminis]
MNMYQSDLRNVHDQCKNYQSYHVTLTMTDGRTMDGIIDNVTMDHVSVLVGEDVMDREEETESDTRYYGGFGGYGVPRRRFRRFRRFDFPLATIAALALLPYIAPPPAYPYYPYYPYY